MRIEKLAHHRHLIDSIVSTLHSSWGELPPWSDRETIRARLDASAAEALFPHTLVAVTDNGDLVATGSIKRFELPSHPDKTYWIGEIFVLPAYRNQGLGSRLTTALTDYAFAHGVPRIYLYTPDQQALYKRLGWQEVCTDTANTESVSIMVLTPRDA
jgi:GNAT superfamily N-acetyltransferase